MSERDSHGVRRWDQALSWLTLLYGIYCAAFDAAHSRDELQIAVGAELILVSLLDFMWARARRSLGAGLILVGLFTPAIGFGSAPLFWHRVQAFSGTAFWTSMILGSVVAVPLIWLGLRTRRLPITPNERPDPRWLTPVRWAMRCGLWIIVLAFRLGDFNTGALLVYLGAALALFSLALGLPLRLSIDRRGVGRLFLFLGGCALLVTAVAGGLLGSHMSGEEAMYGAGPAVLLMIVGGAMVRSSPRPPAGS